MQWDPWVGEGDFLVSVNTWEGSCRVNMLFNKSTFSYWVGLTIFATKLDF